MHATEQTGNNFNFMRLLAAMTVIMTHSLVLTGDGVSKDVLYGITHGDLLLSLVGLRIFFTISGYLICQSLERSRTYLSYLSKRVLRIFPAFIVCILLTIFVIGPVFTTLSLKSYLTNTETHGYFLNFTLYAYRLYLPGVFTNHTKPEVNGSIWTLCYEFSYYLMIMVLGITGLFRRRWLGALCFVIFLALQVYTLYWHVPPKLFYFLPYTNLDLKNFSDFGLYFTAGTLLYLYRKHIPYTLPISIGCLVLYFVSVWMNAGWLARYVTLPYLIMYIAFVPKADWITNWGKENDLSYGMYIYGMPVQQMLLSFTGRNANPNLLSLFSILLLFPIAWISWHFIESKAMMFKKYFDRKPRYSQVAV